MNDVEAAETYEPDIDGSNLSLKAQYDHDNDVYLHVDEQEDGYISATPYCSKDLQDLSSQLPRFYLTPACRK